MKVIIAGLEAYTVFPSIFLLISPVQSLGIRGIDTWKRIGIKPRESLWH